MMTKNMQESVTNNNSNMKDLYGEYHSHPNIIKANLEENRCKYLILMKQGCQKQ